MIQIHRTLDALKRSHNHSKLIDVPRSAGITHWPPRRGVFAGHCSVITSLSPNPKRLARQIYCLQSWIDIGLDVIAVNTQDEIDSLYFPPGVTAVASEDVTTDYERPTQRISAIVNVGIETDRPFFIINSDIEIHGHTQVIANALAASDQLTIGIRWNYDGVTQAERELWGLDCFCLTPAMARTLPQMPFGIGKPMWDYWFPYHFRAHGFGFHWIDFPFLFHRSHGVYWSNDEWIQGAKAIDSQYGISMISDCLKFRQSLDKDVP